ncbi:MAG: Ig-like domain-containing protein, partial [Planctomycetota bacterium]
MRKHLLFGLICLLTIQLQAGEGAVFPVTVAVQMSPAQATFAWPSQPAGTVTSIYRRNLGTTGSGTWTLRGTATQPVVTYTDAGLTVGTSYEYKVACTAGTSYSAVSIDAPLVDSRGAVLLVVDNTIAADLAGPLTRLEMDLVGDGWEVVRMDSPRHGAGTPEALKTAIKSAVTAKPTINSVLLFGKLPMVRSGILGPDGHTPYRAHETDTFYADQNGTWTDTTKNVVDAASPEENQNIPGDGKYDQDSYPTALELAVGRVTFHNLPSFRKSEIEYLRDYLHKDHAWRMGQRNVQYRAYHTDSGNGYYLYTARNWFSPMFGTSGVTFGTQQPAMSTGTYLWSVDATGSAGPVNGQAVQAIFTENFKSWRQMFWRADNTMRGMLAQPDWGLTCVWGARPNWYFHHMAAGKPIGYSALRTQNTAFNGNEYGPDTYGYMNSYVSNNFMGDPTLRMHPVLPAGPVTVARSGSTANLAWTASAAPALLGYHVYRSTSRLGSYTRLTASPTVATSFADTTAPVGVVYYQVRAVATTTALTGSYINQSQASFVRLNADGTGNRAPTAAPGNLTVKTNSPGWFAFPGSDLDGDALTPVVVQNPQRGQLRWYKGHAYYVSSGDYIGSDSIVFSLSDGVCTSAPATITVTVDAVGDTLLGWKCPDVSGTPLTDATWVASNMQSAAVVFGSGSPRTNPFAYKDQILIKSTNGVALSTTKYLGWTVAPASGYRQSLSRTSFGLMTNWSSTITTLNSELRVSTDGFATWTAVPLLAGQTSSIVADDNKYQFQAINTADLSGVAALQNTTAAAEFRLYQWHNGTATDGSGIGRITDVGTDKIEDLVVQGTVVPISGNNAPVISTTKPASLTTLEDTSNSLVIAASDPDANPLSWSVQTQGTLGTMVVTSPGNSTTATYTPTANLNGSDVVVVRVSDGLGGTDTITVNVTITAVNDAPSFTKGANQSVLEDAAAVTVTSWATAISAG